MYPPHPTQTDSEGSTLITGPFAPNTSILAVSRSQSHPTGHHGYSPGIIERLSSQNMENQPPGVWQDIYETPTWTVTGYQASSSVGIGAIGSDFPPYPYSDQFHATPEPYFLSPVWRGGVVAEASRPPPGGVPMGGQGESGPQYPGSISQSMTSSYGDDRDVAGAEIDADGSETSSIGDREREPLGPPVTSRRPIEIECGKKFYGAYTLVNIAFLQMEASDSGKSQAVEDQRSRLREVIGKAELNAIGHRAVRVQLTELILGGLPKPTKRRSWKMILNGGGWKPLAENAYNWQFAELKRKVDEVVTLQNQLLRNKS